MNRCCRFCGANPVDCVQPSGGVSAYVHSVTKNFIKKSLVIVDPVLAIGHEMK